MPITVAELAARLARAAAPICADLFPHGRRQGGEFRVGDLAGNRGSSLSVQLYWPHAGCWIDHAAPDDRGDLLDLVARVRFGGDLRATCDWARAYLGLPVWKADEHPSPPPAAAPMAVSAASPDEDALRRQRAARAIWAKARPSIAGTPAELYLRARGIDLRPLGRVPASLRFFAALRNRETGRDLPAMIAAVRAADGELVAIHRTWLAVDADGVWRKAKLEVPKANLGPVSGGLIHLWRGSSLRPLACALPDETLLLGEGIETCLSAVIAASELRVASAVSLANLGRIELPPAVQSVIVLGENDDSEAARRALRAALQRLAATGRAVRLARPAAGFKDLNDLLRGACEVAR